MCNPFPPGAKRRPPNGFRSGAYVAAPLCPQRGPAAADAGGRRAAHPARRRGLRPHPPLGAGGPALDWEVVHWGGGGLLSPFFFC